MKQQISTLQLVAMLYNTIVPTAILIVPSVVLAHAHQDAWISILSAMLIGIGIAALTGTIAARNPGLAFPAWLSQRFGRVVGLIVGLALTFYYISISSVILKEFTNILTDQILLETPTVVIMILIMAVAGFAVYYGVEVIARLNGVVTSITIAAYVLSFFMFVDLIDFNELQPVMDHSLSKIAYGGLLPLSWLSEVAIVLLLAPYLKKTANAMKAAIWGTALAGFHLAITVALCITVFGPILPVQFRYPSFSMIEVIKMGSTLERLDIMFVAFWLCTIYTKIMLFLFGAYHCLTNTLNLKPSRPILFAICLLILMTAATSLQGQAKFDLDSQHVTPYELLAMNVLLPCLIGLGLIMFKKHTRKRRS